MNLKILFLSIILIFLLNPKVFAAGNEYKPDLYQWPVSKGEMLDWKIVDKILPRGTRFQVIDVDTGLTFFVQRRAGGSHADVQPLTRNDTKIMKLIYGGRWSWERNDIVIKVNDRYIAASMNGMPHGYGALQNGFPGHFCIHFKNSTTHTKNSPDLAHHLFIAKAAGKLGNFTSGLNPLEVIKAYEIGVNHNEPQILKYIITSKKFKSLASFKYLSLQIPESAKVDAPYIKEIHAIGRVQTLDSYRLQKMNLTFLLLRDSVLGKWKIADIMY